MTTTKQQARALEAADKAASFDWEAWNADLDAALQRWNDAEKALSDASVQMARDVREALS